MYRGALSQRDGKWMLDFEPLKTSMLQFELVSSETGLSLTDVINRAIGLYADVLGEYLCGKKPVLVRKTTVKRFALGRLMRTSVVGTLAIQTDFGDEDLDDDAIFVNDLEDSGDKRETSRVQLTDKNARYMLRLGRAHHASYSRIIDQAAAFGHRLRETVGHDMNFGMQDEDKLVIIFHLNQEDPRIG